MTRRDRLETRRVYVVSPCSEMSGCCLFFCLFSKHPPADLRTACTQDIPVALLALETVSGANLSLLMEINVEVEEQTPVSLN